MSLFSVNVFAADDDCWKNFAYTESGNISRSVNGNEVTVKIGAKDGSNVSTGSLRWTMNPDSMYEINFKFKSGPVSAVIRSSDARAYINFNDSNISYNTSSGMGNLAFSMGSDWHDIKIVKKGGVKVYDNGTLLGRISETQNPNGYNGVEFAFSNHSASERETVIKDFSYKAVEIKYDSLKAVDKTEAFVDNFESADELKSYVLTNGVDDSYYLEDGCLVLDVYEKDIVYLQKPIGYSQNCSVEIRMKVENIGAGQGWQIRNDKNRTYLTPYADFFLYLSNAGFTQQRLSADYDPYAFHTWRYDIQGDMAVLYLDGELVLDTIKLNAFNDSVANICLWAQGNNDPSKIYYDYIKYMPEIYDINVQAPLDGAEYPKGTDIELKASTELEDIPEVDWYINGIRVGTAKAPDYKLVYTADKMGEYNVSAKYKDKSSSNVSFNISESVAGVINAPSAVGTSDSVNVSATLFDYKERISSFTYMVDGNAAANGEGENYAANLGTLGAGIHRLSAAAVLDDGTRVYLAEKEICVNTQYGAQLPDTYNLTYTVGDGEGAITTADGRYLLDIKHSSSALTYTAADGTKSLSLSRGAYEIRVDDGVAAIYKDGEFRCEYIMPKTAEHYSAKSGTAITGIDVNFDNCNSAYLREEFSAAKKTVYEELPFINGTYVLDFELAASDDIKISVGDSKYMLNLETKGGEIYAENGTPIALTNDIEYKTEKIADRLQTEGTAGFRAVVSEGIMQLYQDNVWIGAARLRTAGQTGRILAESSSGNGSIAVKTDGYYYKHSQDFASNTDTGYWTMKNLELINESGGVIAAPAGEGKMLLNVSAKNPDITAKLNVSRVGKGFWLVFRHSDDAAYYKIGYNGSTKQWELVQKYGTLSTKATNAGTALTNGDMELTLRTTDNYAALYCNGTLVIDGTLAEKNHGKAGLMFDTASVKLYSVSYGGESKANEGITENILSGESITNDIFKRADGSLYMTADAAIESVSTDGGKTWTSAGKNGTFTGSAIKLKDGSVLTVKEGTSNNGYWDHSAWISTNDGESFSGPYLIRADAKTTDMNGKLFQGKSGRVYYTAMSFGRDVPTMTGMEDESREYVFYSDDGGKTWTTSETAFITRENGYNFQEGKTIELPDGTVRVYFRTDQGCIMYYDSADGGKTFENTPHKTIFAAVQCSMNIIVDPNDENTYYMLWSYDNLNGTDDAHYPRTRAAVAVSHDGCKTWQYVMEASEKDLAYYIGKSNISMQNHGISAADGNVFAMIPQHMPVDGSSETKWFNKVVRIETDKIKPLVRFPGLRVLKERQLGALEEKAADGTIITNGAGEFVVRGKYSYNTEIPNGYITLAMLGEYSGGITAVTDINDSTGGSKKCATCSVGNNIFKMSAGENKFIADGAEYTCELPMLWKNNEVYVPIEAAAKAYGKNLHTFDGITFVTDAAELTDADKQACKGLLN